MWKSVRRSNRFTAYGFEQFIFTIFNGYEEKSLVLFFCVEFNREKRTTENRSSIDEMTLANVQEAIESAHGMKLKINNENEKCELDCLQLTVRRNPKTDNRIDIRWMQRDYSWKCILNYHSFHPWRMKMNVITEFVRNDFKLSSRIHASRTMNAIRKVLRNSNYPHRLINEKMS